MAEKQIIPHDLEVPLAKRATEHAFAAYKARFSEFNPTENWVSENRSEIAFSVKGLTLEGAIEIHPGEIHLELEVPFLLKPFRKKALSVIESEIEEWVAKAKAGELDEA